MMFVKLGLWIKASAGSFFAHLLIRYSKRGGRFFARRKHFTIIILSLDTGHFRACSFHWICDPAVFPFSMDSDRNILVDRRIVSSHGCTEPMASLFTLVTTLKEEVPILHETNQYSGFDSTASGETRPVYRQ